jgi:hypothetical protein
MPRQAMFTASWISVQSGIRATSGNVTWVSGLNLREVLATEINLNEKR